MSITQNPTSATVAGGNNVVMNFTVDATGLYAGSYFLELALTSNDTALDGMKIPVIVNVTGMGFGSPIILLVSIFQGIQEQ